MMQLVHDLLCESGIAINDPQSYGEFLAQGSATTVLITILMAGLVALVLTPVFRAAYRRRVTRLMRFHQIDASVADTETMRDLTSFEHLLEASVRRADKADVNLIDAAARCQRRIVRGTAIALAVFAAGGAIAARAYGLDWIGSATTGVLAATIAAGPMVINVRPYSSRSITLLTFVLLTSALFIALGLSPRLWSGVSAFQLIDNIASTIVVSVGMVLGLVHRTRRDCFSRSRLWCSCRCSCSSSPSASGCR